MKLCIVLVLLYGYICHGSDIWYQAEMSMYFVPSFQSVYTTLQQNILDKLLVVDSDSLITDNSALMAFISNLHCEVESLLNYLDTSITISKNIRVKVDHKLATIMNDISIKENEIAHVHDQIQELNEKIQDKQSEISLAEQSVRQAEDLVAKAEKALAHAEKEAQNAELCAGLIGRRRRFLGGVWNSIQNSVVKPVASAVNTMGGAIESAVNTATGAVVDNVVKPVCSVVNVQQLDGARRNVENKKNELSLRRDQLQTLKNGLNSMKNDLVIYNTELHNLNYQLNQLQGSLVALPNEQHIIVSINEKLTDVAGHIRAAFDGSISFLDAMTKAIDSDSIVKPLNAIYDELQENNVMKPFNAAKISMEQINRAKINLQALIAFTANIALNMVDVRCAN